MLVEYRLIRSLIGNLDCSSFHFFKILISQWITYQCSILDGILNLEFAKTLSGGTGKVHGIDSSEAMINAAKKAAAADPAASKTCTFEGMQIPPSYYS